MTEWLEISERGPLSSTAVLIVPGLVSCEEQGSCTALIPTGKRCEHKCCTAAAAAEQPTTCQKCRVTLRAATWPGNALSHWTTLYAFFVFLAGRGQLALRKWTVRYSVKGVMTMSLPIYTGRLWNMSWSFINHLTSPLWRHVEDSEAPFVSKQTQPQHYKATSVEQCKCNSTGSNQPIKMYENLFTIIVTSGCIITLFPMTCVQSSANCCKHLLN